MSHFFTILIALRVIFCPLLCEVQGCTPMRALLSEDQNLATHHDTCCSHCALEPTAPASENSPTHSCPDCDCFCSQSAIVGMKVDLDDMSSSVWEAYFPSQDRWQVAENRTLIDLASTRSTGITPGRSLRLAFASLLI